MAIHYCSNFNDNKACLYSYYYSLIIHFLGATAYHSLMYDNCSASCCSVLCCIPFHRVGYIVYILQNELSLILDLGVTPDRIIFANPCKMVSHLKFAADKGVSLMTFDTLSELHKTKEYFPEAK